MLAIKGWMADIVSGNIISSLKRHWFVGKIKKKIISKECGRSDHRYVCLEKI